jgi:hypothetical protein
MVPGRSRAWQAIRAGMTACGFDGAELGRVSRVSLRQQALQVVDGVDVFVLPLKLVGLVGPNFVMFRGTGGELRAFATGGTPQVRTSSDGAAMERGTRVAGHAAGR